MNKAESTRFDKTLERIKNHKFLSIVLVLGAVFVAVASFLDAWTTIGTLFTTERTQLEVTDILVSPVERGTMTLDIRVVNNSKKTITVSRLRLKPLYFEDKTADQAQSPSGSWTNVWIIRASITALGSLCAPARTNTAAQNAGELPGCDQTP